MRPKFCSPSRNVEMIMSNASPKKISFMKRYLLLFAAIAVLCISCKKEDTPSSIDTRILINTLNYPWEILWGPDNYIWFTEREGRVKRINPESGQVVHIATISEVASTTDFNGLLGMVLHPHFITNPYVYLVYNYFDAKRNYLEKVVRFTYNGSTLVSPMTIVDGILGKIGGDFIHNGSRLAIGPDMKLYITTGDANLRFTLPQNTSSLNGKVLRVNLDGTIPLDNPYGNQVWSIGHRNAQGLVFGNGVLYSSEHGETTDDEINSIEKGGNYGWPYVEGFCDMPSEQTFCTSGNIEQPMYAWTPTIAPSGIDYYNNHAIAQWKNSILVVFLKGKRLVQMKLNNNGTVITNVHEYFNDQFGRLRDIAISPSGKVYMCTDNGNNSDMIIEVRKEK